jgi:hypothetical protein
LTVPVILPLAAAFWATLVSDHPDSNATAATAGSVHFIALRIRTSFCLVKSPECDVVLVEALGK